jgi:ABC-type antimicrobial peptide transport system permease subunit
LGIVIGVAAVIAMMEIGQGSSKAIQEMIARMGANNLMVQPGTAASGGISLGGGSQQTLTLKDYEALDEQRPLLASVAPVVRSRTQIVYGNKNWVPFYHVRHDAVVLGCARMAAAGRRFSFLGSRCASWDAGVFGG